MLDKRTKKTYSEYALQLTNAIFTQHVVDKGITNDKSDVLFFPDINEEYYSYFIAGMFDGDGSVTIRKNGLMSCNLISTKEILDFINEYFYKKFGWIPCKVTKVTKNKTNVYKLYMYTNSYEFLKFIYCGEPSIYLSRKYNIFKNYNYNPKRKTKSSQPVAMYSLDGNLLKDYHSILEMKKDTGIDPSIFYNKESGHIMKHNDYIWVFHDKLSIPLQKIEYERKDNIS